MNFFVCFYRWSEENKFYYFESDSDIPSEDDKLVQSLQLLAPSEVSSFRVFNTSDASFLQMLLKILF